MASPHTPKRGLVLVADDDPVMRLLMLEMLTQVGLDMVEAEDGASALACYQSLQPDLVLLDVDMPGIDGFEVCRQIRALSAANGNALLERVLQAYLQDTPAHLATLRSAITARNTLSIRKAAHSLKSSSANVGAHGMAQRCKELEQLGRNNTTAGAAALLADTERSFQAARQALGAILEKEI